MADSEINLHSEIKQLKKEILILKKKVEVLCGQSQHRTLNERYQLLRIKNKDELSDQYILNGMGYLDLSPDKAFRLYNEIDKDYILLDVSSESYTPFKDLKEARKIPLEKLKENLHLLANKNQSIMIISEKGVRSILACKILNKFGFYNLNNISGGYKYWPGFRLSYDQHDFDDFLKEA